MLMRPYIAMFIKFMIRIKDLSLCCDVMFQQVKQIEKRDSVLTSKQQIDRLLRPGASYFNLNPFEVTRTNIQ